jgi:hypothetical protein
MTGFDQGVDVADGGAHGVGAVFLREGDEAVDWVERDFVYGVDEFGFAIRFGEVHGGDLETVEEQAGTAGVDFVGGDALEDFSEGVLDGGAVLGRGECERTAGAAGFGVGDGPAGGVVVVTEGFEAQAGGAAAVPVCEDVAALLDGG